MYKTDMEVCDGIIIVPHLGITLRTLLAAADTASKLEGNERRNWRFNYKGVIIGSIRICNDPKKPEKMGDDQWMDAKRRYPQGIRMFGKIIQIADHGVFVELEPGIKGRVHKSEMDWFSKNVDPAKIVAIGDEVEVMVLEIDEDKCRISLSMKQCKTNPWQEFAQNTKRGDRVKGPIKSITDFGVFVGLAAGIDGLVHLSDLSWNEPGEAAVREYKKGQEVEALVLAMDVDHERISLGIKQLDSDPFTTFSSINDKGSFS